MLIPFLILLFLFVCAGTAHAQDVVLIPSEPPPAGTDWKILVGVGAFYAITISLAVRKQVPYFVGWRTPLLLVPLVSIGVAIYQVGYSDPAMTAKHAAGVFVTAYGGHNGGKRLLAWIVQLVVAARAGTTLPPPPDLEQPPSSPASKLPSPPPLPSSSPAGASEKRIALARAALAVVCLSLFACAELPLPKEVQQVTDDAIVMGTESANLANGAAKCFDDRRDLKIAFVCKEGDAACVLAAREEAAEHDGSIAKLREVFCRYAGCQ